MKFTVEALDSVNETLAALYNNASDREAVRDAADWIELQLKTDPLTKVTAVDDLYFLRRDFLVALCRINVDNRLVTIVEMHRTDQP